jgi:hypothetical protein
MKIFTKSFAIGNKKLTTVSSNDDLESEVVLLYHVLELLVSRFESILKTSHTALIFFRKSVVDVSL